MKLLIISAVLFHSTEFCAGENGYTIPRHIQYSYSITNQSDQTVSSAEFLVYGPVHRTSSQACEQVTASHPFQLSQDRLGNQLLSFHLENIPPFGAVIVNIEARLRFAEKPVSVSDDLALYLSAGKNMQSDEPLIKKKAHALKSDDRMQTIAKIFHFVSHHIVSSGYSKRDHGALYALQKKEGDCTEFMDLFVALCRANQIPARGLGGYCLKENGPLHPGEYHNWAEFFYEGAWHTADPQKKLFMPPGGGYLGLRILGGAKDDYLDADEQFKIKGENLKVRIGG